MSGILKIEQAVKSLSPTELRDFRSWFLEFDDEASRLMVLEDEKFEALLDKREAELSEDPSLELSEEAFLAHFNARRAS